MHIHDGICIFHNKTRCMNVLYIKEQPFLYIYNLYIYNLYPHLHYFNYKLGEIFDLETERN
jgi:hypothetical protein